jgi:predicted DNA-binding transcriptional regulator AlpA
VGCLIEAHTVSTHLIPEFDSLPDSAFVRQKQIIPAVVPISPATFWRMVKAGSFPKPTSLGPNMTAWQVGAVREWLRAPR